MINSEPPVASILLVRFGDPGEGERLRILVGSNSVRRIMLGIYAATSCYSFAWLN